MIKTYLKIAWRNIIRDKSSSLINIVGLAIGMAASALIILWIQHELTFDRFYSKTDRIYEVYNRGNFNDKTWAWSGQANPLASLLKKDYPAIESAARYSSTSLMLSDGEKYFRTEGAYADSSFFHIFDFSFIHGNSTQALSTQKSIVLTASLADKLFGTLDIIGKNVQIDSSEIFTVTALIRDIPTNSRFRDASYFVPWTYFEERQLGEQTASSWTGIKVPTFILLKAHVAPATIETEISQLLLDLEVSKNKLFLHPASKWHLYTKAENGYFIGGKIDVIRLFAAIALIILLIACVNFINLSTAKSEQRAKEVGVRKVMGAQKKMLVTQFLSESVLLSFVAGLGAFLLVLASLAHINSLLDTVIVLAFANKLFWLYAFSFIVITGVLAGLYPALFLSSFQPVVVLKGVSKYRVSRISLRKVLIVFQFTFSIALIIATWIIYRQLMYAESRDNGYDKNNLISLPLSASIRQHFDPIRHELLNSGAVSSITRSSGTITQHSFGATNFSWPGSTTDDLSKAFVALTADADFKNTMGIKMVLGRDIDIRHYPTDSTAMLLNESAVKAMKLADPIGTVIRNGEQQWHVVGIVSDFIFYSPYTAINPLFILGSGDWFNFMYLKLNPHNHVAQNLAITENILKKYDPISSFDYAFTDEIYEKNFENEHRTAVLISLFSGITLLTTCLGLFGLIAYVITLRKKEISVRKILGASLQSTAFLLSKEFMILISISFVIASPIAYWAMEKWLQNFTYRIAMPWGIFVLTAIFTFLITLVTIGIQIMKAAMANPVDSLRDE